MGARQTTKLPRPLLHLNVALGAALTLLAGLWFWDTVFPVRERPRGVTLGGVLVVNLDSQPEKWDAMSRELAKSRVLRNTKWGIHRLSGVVGAQCDLFEYLSKRKITPEAYNRLVDVGDVVGGHFLTAGALGCFESHVHAWERVVAEGTPAVIFEDDVVLRDDFDPWMSRVLENLPSDFGLFYFGNIIGRAIKPALTGIDPVLYRVSGHHYGTYAYIVSPSAALTLLRYAYPAYAQVDSVIIDIAQKHAVDVYMSKRVLVATDNSPDRESSTQRYAPPAMFIPPVFHFAWLGLGPLPQLFSQRMLEWGHMHPGWTVELWNRTHLPPLSRALALLVAAAVAQPGSSGSEELASHIVRYSAVLEFGGVFLDDSMEPLKPVVPILRGLDAFVVRTASRQLCSCAFGAVPGHALLRLLVGGLSTDVPPIGGWGVAGRRAGARLITSAFFSSDLVSLPRVRAFAPHVWYSPLAGSEALSFAVRREYPAPGARIYNFT